MRCLFVSSFFLALSGIAAATGSVAIVQGSDTIVGVDGETLVTNSFAEQPSAIVKLTTFNNTVYAATYQILGSTLGSISAFDVLFDDLGFGPSEDYDSCNDPTDITATFDAPSPSYVIMTCTNTTLVVDPVTLELVQAVPTPTIDDIQIVRAVSAAAAGDYLFIAYQTKLVRGERFVSKGLLVQYDINSFSILGSKRIIGTTIYLVASTKRGLLLTSSGFGRSFFRQMELANLRTMITMRSDDETFRDMSITPDEKSLYISYEGSDGNTGGIRSIDLTASPAEQLCRDSPIQGSPVGASTVMDGSLYVASGGRITRYELNQGNRCPLTGTVTSVGESELTTNAITSMCTECDPPMSR
uniref:SMP-30/Gluconolactonase/LRE-like region domain-containing protein n=1 Tax=Rhodosorus marinus TaxID=101924 RepID=A0A7S0BLU7_9RHOD|mmetsp:Transcript_22347/g.32256  ORF Transcript_22347/g.32256 Transcript_22347/m.32256 type:complete len:357 (+) Transcript_22347:181-1251(+)|eukprot:CAMPEP_0184738110 /NCGR_PEP_ID=MMETSP0315-20130426/840_1 /TAXON_ID=101924 /ORGANISM="Rhodosorus marinus, Strain UTEX LB 2760" /LENGTH=356 /DNA_ID=CAMNT_0027205685 /DNA_START=168 /DNA_END=1238 /DNA_ORIENTATION=-